jgi:hypothetical protein
MALTDWRRVLDADPHRAESAIVVLEVIDAGADRPAAFRHQLHIDVPTAGGAALDYYALGELLDQLHEAAGVLLALQGDPVAAAALVGLRAARDTPSDARA